MIVVNKLNLFFFHMNFYSLIYQWMFVGIRWISFFFISKWSCVFSLIHEWMFIGNKVNPFFHILKWSCIFSLIYEWTCQQFVWVFWPEKVSNQERKGFKKNYETNWLQKNTVCFRGSLSSKSFMTTVFFLKKSDEAMRVGNHKKVPKIRTIFVN